MQQPWLWFSNESLNIIYCWSRSPQWSLTRKVRAYDVIIPLTRIRHSTLLIMRAWNAFRMPTMLSQRKNWNNTATWSFSRSLVEAFIRNQSFLSIICVLRDTHRIHKYGTVVLQMAMTCTEWCVLDANQSWLWHSRRTYEWIKRQKSDVYFNSTLSESRVPYLNYETSNTWNKKRMQWGERWQQQNKIQEQNNWTIEYAHAFCLCEVHFV